MLSKFNSMHKNGVELAYFMEIVISSPDFSTGWINFTVKMG